MLSRRSATSPIQTKSIIMKTLIFFRTQTRTRGTGATETSRIFALSTSHALSTSLTYII